jgi:ketoreductase RED2
MQNKTLTGKTVLVTGSSSGIGEAVARRFAQDGASVVINSARSVEPGRAVADSLPGATYVQGDISDADDCERIIAQTVSQFGRLDVLINNAGTTEVIPHADLEAVTDELWHRILDVNVIGTWRMSKLAVPALKTANGSIINISSVAGVRAMGSSIPYSVSKAAINHLTVLLAKVVGPEIRVNAVAPGLIDTPWTETWDKLRSGVVAAAPLQRSGLPDDVAEACLGLTRSTYVTGQVLVVDGGITIVS